MRSTRDLSIVIWLLCAALVAGCAGDRMNQSTEEAVDDSLLANKVKMALYADKQVRGRQIDGRGFARRDPVKRRGCEPHRGPARRPDCPGD